MADDIIWYSFEVLEVLEVGLFGSVENFIDEHQGSLEIKIVRKFVEHLADYLLKDWFLEGLKLVLLVFVLTRQQLGQKGACWGMDHVGEQQLEALGVSLEVA